MTAPATLSTLLPIRDRRDRVVGYVVSSCPAQEGVGGSPDEEAKAALENVSRIARLAGRSIIVPISPALVRDGSITRFASTEAVWLLATSALDDPATRRAVDRLLGQGFYFALEGFPEGQPLLPSLMGSTIVLDAARTPPSLLESRIRMLVDAGLRPLTRGVDDRAVRQRALAAGAALHTGRLLVRGGSTRVDRSAEESVLRAMTMLGAFADGRPPDGSFDAYIQDDPNMGAAIVRAMSSAALGIRGPRSVTHALTVLGRDAVMEQLVTVAARLIGDAAGDPELAFVALRRARLCERMGAALDPAPHPRARSVAGLLSVLEFSLGVPSCAIVERIALPQVVRDTLERRITPLGRLLDAVDAIDYGWWDDFRTRCGDLGIAPHVLSAANSDAWRDARDELGFSRSESS
jgi:EAL and modified HD-GYP domain-containing signal transduction protein